MRARRVLVEDCVGLPRRREAEVFMPDSFARLLLWISAAHLLAGTGFALFALRRGLGRIDRTASAATWGAKAVLLPGLILLWPLLIRRWRRAEGQPPLERTAHRRAEVRG